MNDHTTPQSANEIPYGYCQCGCGQKTTVAKKNDAHGKTIKGEPNRYMTGHRPAVVQPDTLEQRFWQRVDKREENDCWLWTGPLTKKKRGTITNNHRAHLAHRVSYELHFGAIPEDMNVCHSCDNPSCVNPSHLWLGTQAENMQDCQVKGRYSPVDGQSNPNSKLTEADVVEIRRLAATGIRKATIARQFGVTKTNIGDIVSGKRWKHVP